MVIVDMDLNVFLPRQLGELSDAALLSGIHQNEPLDVIQINLFNLGEVKEVRYGIDKEIAEAFFLGAGKHEGGFRVELARG